MKVAGDINRDSVRAELERVESDERLGYPAAHVMVNAPLAIVQIELKARATALRWVLGHGPGEYHKG